MARSVGCDNHKFLFLGSDPPAQCGAINAQIARMQSDLAELQARDNAGGDLVARYNAECRTAPAGQPAQQYLRGFVRRRRKARVRSCVAAADRREGRTARPDEGSPNGSEEKSGVNAHSGSYVVCVRTCDGSFFPVSYSGVGGRADGLEEVCRALCPNADMALYSFPFGGTIEQAASPTGEAYANLPNAGKFQQTYDASCSCRRKGQSWAEALADAEARYGHEKHDIVVTAEKSAEMARPIVDPKAKPVVDPKAKAAAATGAAALPGAPVPPVAAAPPGPAPADAANTTVLDANGAETKLGAEAATISREGSGIAGGDTEGAKSFNKDQGQRVEVTGPDGVKRLVRIVGPTL